MSKRFGSFYGSELGGFEESPLRARGHKCHDFEGALPPVARRGYFLAEECPRWNVYTFHKDTGAVRGLARVEGAERITADATGGVYVCAGPEVVALDAEGAERWRVDVYAMLAEQACTFRWRGGSSTVDLVRAGGTLAILIGGFQLSTSEPDGSMVRYDVAECGDEEHYVPILVFAAAIRPSDGSFVWRRGMVPGQSYRGPGGLDVDPSGAAWLSGVGAGDDSTYETQSYKRGCGDGFTPTTMLGVDAGGADAAGYWADIHEFESVRSVFAAGGRLYGEIDFYGRPSSSSFPARFARFIDPAGWGCAGLGEGGVDWGLHCVADDVADDSHVYAHFGGALRRYDVSAASGSYEGLAPPSLPISVDGDQLWEAEPMVGVAADRADGNLYGTRGGPGAPRLLVRVDGETGETVWRTPLSAATQGIASAPRLWAR